MQQDAEAGLVPPAPEPLLRQLVGAVLHRRRRMLGLTLGEAARRAGVSPQYLSEMERGRKDPSSEMVEAVAGALGLDLLGVVEHVAEALRRAPAALPSSVRPLEAPRSASRPADGSATLLLAA